jgi:hypothetical protein
MIAKYFSNSRPSQDMQLVDYIICRSKANCNYLKLIDLIKRACRSDEDDEYGTKKFDINFYPVSSGAVYLIIYKIISNKSHFSSISSRQRLK